MLKRLTSQFLRNTHAPISNSAYTDISCRPSYCIIQGLQDRTNVYEREQEPLCHCRLSGSQCQNKVLQPIPTRRYLLYVTTCHPEGATTAITALPLPLPRHESEIQSHGQTRSCRTVVEHVIDLSSSCSCELRVALAMLCGLMLYLSFLSST